MRFAVVLTLIFTIGIGNVWGATAIFTASEQGWSGTSTKTQTVSGVTFSFAGGTSSPTYYSDGLRTYEKCVITISSSNTITGITFAYTVSNSGTLKSFTTGTWTSGTKTWSGSATTISCTVGHSSGTKNGQVRITEIVVTYTPSAASHTLSSAVSPAESGSVELSATSVAEGSTATATATPAAHYVFDHWSISGTGSTLSSTTANPTTITMGTANTTVTATFVAAPKASVTLSEAGATTTDATTYYVGDSYILPSTTEASCGTKVLVGWSTVTVSETDIKPASNFYEKGETVTLKASQTFYAVFANASGTPGSWDPVTSAPSDWSGDYVIVNSAKTYAMTSDFYSGTSGEFLGASVTITDDKVVSPTDKMIWTVAKNGDNAQYSFKNKSTGTYANITGTSSTNAALSDNANWFTIASSGTKGVWKVNSVSYSARCFAWYADRSSFRTYAKSTNNTGYLYKKSGGTTYSAYSTSCEACTNNVTISQGSESNGTFTLSATGAQPSCAGAVNIIVTPSPEDGYRVENVTATEGSPTITDNGNGTWTVSFAQNTNVSSIINVSFEAIPTYTVSWSVNGADWTGAEHGNPSTSVTYNTKPSTIPTAPVSADCDGSKVFVGWTNAKYEDPDDAPAVLFTSQAGAPEITSNTTFYAVFATSSGGGVTFDHYEKVTTAPDDWTAYKYVIATADDGVVLTGKNGDNNYGAYATMSTTTEMASYEISLDEVSSGVYKVLQNSKYLSLSANANSLYFTDTYTGANETHTNCDWKIWYYSSGGGYVVESTKTYTISGNSGKYRVIQFNSDRFACYQSMTQSPGYLYKRVESGSVTYSDYATTCCQQPVTQLAIAADPTELVSSGAVNFTLTGGNGKDIIWSCRDESDVNCDALLTSTSNSGATLTISSPVAATKTYTVKAVQPENDDDAEVVCGKMVTMDITVKAQFAITLNIKDHSETNVYDTYTVTDGESYTLPDISDDYNCDDGYSFAGWSTSESATSVEKTAGSTVTATAATTWWAVWSQDAVGSETVTKYEKVTAAGELVADATFVLAYKTYAMNTSVSSGYAGKVSVTLADDGSYVAFPSTTTTVQILTLKGSTGAWKLYDATNSKWLVMNTSGKISWTDTEDGATAFAITFTDGNAVINAGSYFLQYNASSPRFKGYESTSDQNNAVLYKDNGNTVSIASDVNDTYFVNNEHCSSGSIIRAESDKWVTSAKDQKVRITVPVTAKNFETSGKQMSATSDNSHFAVSMASHTIPSDKSEVEVQMTVEYTPTEANTIEEANITITTGTGDGNATKVISVNGRSLPDEFVIVTQKEGKWQALPADMFSGTGTYSPIEVTPNGGITAIPAAPYTTIYSAREVASGRYESAGTCMRLVGNNNKCLWANSSGNGTGIQNFAALGNTNGAQYEWLLSTADGEQYTIANPAHPDYATGRQLGIYTLKYGLYKTTDIFYLLPVGCSSQPGNLQITPRRVDAMFSWETNTASVTIDLWTNEAMSEGHQQAVVTSVPYQFTGLTENTDYWYKITPGSDDDCALTGSFSTTGPTIELVEWGENSATIFVDKDEAVDPQIIIAGEVEHGQGSGAAATDIFFSKYFEAEGTAKMLAIYNGTGNAISLADITILHRSTTKNYTPLSLASYGKTAGWIQPGEEIILFNRDNRAAVMKCAESDPTYPSWNYAENNTNLAFSGKGTIRLFRGNECIDIIGAMAAGKDINDKAVNPIEGSGSPSFGDDNGFVSTSGDNYATKGTVENNYELSTNRCLLIRQNWVTSGDSAVLNNFDDFKTLGTYTGVDSKTHKGEWAGLQVPDAVAPEADYIHTCEGFQEVGKFDYNKYYREYTQIGNDKHLSDFTRAADGTYTLPIAYMRQYACLNLKFQLTEHNNKTNVLTEQTVQVPIVVKDVRNSNDTLFNNIIKADEAPHTPMVPQSIERCKTCNVVVLSTGTLTKATDGATNDVAEVRDVKVYPGGKLIVPEGTHYVINSLSLRRQEDEIASAKLDAGLSSDPSDVSNKGLYIRESNGVYLDVRIDPSNWHYFTLPYDCRVGDIRFSDGTPAKVNNDYLLSWYDGAYRAEHKDGGWTDITEEDYVLKKGLGYIVALPGEGLIKRELRFPMANEVISAELANKEVGGLYAYGGDKTDEELRPNHKGWNMIGNPYLYDYTTDIVNTPLATGELIHDPSSPWNGLWVRTGSARYIVEPIDNGWTGYRQTTISNLKPFTSYFIQIGTTTDGKDDPETERKITFNKTSKASIARRNMPAEEAEEPMYPVWYGIEMTAPNAEKDNTTLLISDEFTDGYDMMDDLIKMRGSYYQYYPYPVLASRNNEGEMAFNALPDSSAAVIGIPLNYYAAQAGTYTIRTDSRFDLEEVKSAMLFDATTNQYNDLLAGDYSFTTAKGDNTNRFKLYVRVERKKAPEVATRTDNILENGKLSLIAIDRTLVLSGLTEDADIYVYDMSGKLIKGERNASEGVWRANVPAQGVYFVRVNSVAGQQTLRTIVK
ncbi:MAG: T9SS type A sorting domain-containing protein [Paludibacteraceae bacterium]